MARRLSDGVVNAADVVAALRVHYGDAWALIEQVGDATGSYAQRHLDVVAMGLWPSRGLELHGIEVKVGKSDLKRELAMPEKAEAVARRCDRFWIAAPAGIADVGRLELVAPGWGLMEVGPKGVTVTRQAAKREDVDPIDRKFLAAVLRRLPKPTDEMRQEAAREARIAERANHEADVEREVERRLGAHTKLRERVADFAAASGIDLSLDWHDADGRPIDNEWRSLSGEGIGAAVAFIARERSANKRYDGLAYRLAGAASGARHHGEELVRIASVLEEAASGLGLQQ